MNNQTQTQSTQDRQPLCIPTLPLAIYREVAAHLRQVTGVDVELVPQMAQTFGYRQSQIGGLKLRFTDAADPSSQQRVQQILDYYGKRYGNWQPMSAG
jgi:hypothetical protein